MKLHRTCRLAAPQQPVWRWALVSAAALLVAGASSSYAQLTPGQPDSAAGDVAWATLAPRLPSRERPASAPATRIDWATVGADAAAFRSEFPTHPKARVASRLELTALIYGEHNRPELSADTVSRVQAYLDDKANPTRDRLQLKITVEQAKLRRASHTSRSERLEAKAAHARELITEFPSEPEGYGYQLSLAKAESPDNARRLANELLDAPVPEAINTGAQRVLARLDLEGKPFALDRAKTAIDEARDHSLVVYSWSLKDQGFLEIVRRLTRFSDVRFIGVNLDEDQSDARAMAADLGLPGTQLYDGGGLDGPAARQLHLIMTASLYIIDGKGVVRFVNGHQDPQAKLTQLSLEKGFQP